MAEFIYKVNKKQIAKFTVPDQLTVRQQLTYLSAVASLKLDFERFWAGAMTLIQSWESELIPDAKLLDLDVATDPKITNLIVWVGWQVKMHMDRLEEVPKNS